MAPQVIGPPKIIHLFWKCQAAVVACTSCRRITKFIFRSRCWYLLRGPRRICLRCWLLEVYFVPCRYGSIRCSCYNAWFSRGAKSYFPVFVKVFMTCYLWEVILILLVLGVAAWLCKRCQAWCRALRSCASFRYLYLLTSSPRPQAHIPLLLAPRLVLCALQVWIHLLSEWR